MDGFAYGLLPRKEKETLLTPPLTEMPGKVSRRIQVASKKGGGVDSVFFHTGGNGKDIGIKDDICGIEVKFIN